METIGKDINDTCPSCSQGNLQPVLVDGVWRSLGRSRFKVSVKRLERVSCDQCFASYECKNRGMIYQEGVGVVPEYREISDKEMAFVRKLIWIFVIFAVGVSLWCFIESLIGA